MPISPQSSYDELVAENAQLKAALTEALGLVEVLRGEIESLKVQVSATSKNSSKPPSSDGLAKPAPKSLRGKSGRKPGRPNTPVVDRGLGWAEVAVLAVGVWLLELSEPK